MGFKPAPEVEEIAEAIFAEHYPEYADLDLTFRFLYTDKETKAKGRSVAGNARLLTGVAAYLTLYPEGNAPVDFSEDDETRLFLITVWDEAWHKVYKTHHQRKALVHHYLMRCQAFEEEPDEHGNSKLVMRIVHPEIEAFPAEIPLYGAWNVDIDAFLKAVKEAEAQGAQLSLFEIEKLPCAEKSRAADSGEPGPKIPFDEYRSGMPRREGA